MGSALTASLLVMELQICREDKNDTRETANGRRNILFTTLTVCKHIAQSDNAHISIL